MFGGHSRRLGQRVVCWSRCFGAATKLPDVAEIPSMKVGALRAAAIQAVQAAIDAHKLADKLEESWQKQEQSWQKQEQSWQKQEQSWQKQEQSWQKQEQSWQKQEQGWQKQEKLHLELKKVLFSQIDMRDAEILRLRCVFTARGVFEHAAYEAHNELRNAGTDVPAPRVGERFVATQALQAVQRHGDFLHKQPVGFTWCKRLLTAHKQCATDEHQTMTLSEIYGVLSQQIHGYPWSGESVLMSDKLHPFPRCVVASIAEQAGYGWQVGNVLPEELTLEETS